MDDDSLSAPPAYPNEGPSPQSPETAEDPAVDALGDARARWEQAAALFLRWRDGDSHAIDELVRLMTPVLWHVVRAYGLRASVAEDVVQTTWLTLVRKHDTIENPQAVSGWLTITARREAWRASRADRRADTAEDEQLEARLPPQAATEDDVARADASRLLWTAVGTLNDRCQRLLRVVAFDERPDYARIASDLHMPVGSIGPTRQRCLAKLRSALDEIGLDPKERHE